ncbi:unnamed protein product [Cuscuta campestris]|uniref:Retrotransposon gag domain-containing protein n=1 Tax=Cuscuta campestris TaxID=132261 RepID=A0A484M4C2_9ASTE|nr:unnamed protein product [Cuscuta campestris]
MVNGFAAVHCNLIDQANPTVQFRRRSEWLDGGRQFWMAIDEGAIEMDLTLEDLMHVINDIRKDLQSTRANNTGATWDEFLVAVHQRFDPHYYENYVHMLSKLTQTSSVMDYQTTFESLLNKVLDVSEATIVSMFVAGLKQPIQREVNLQNPTTLLSAFALARELEACHADAATAYSLGSRRSWPPRSPTSRGPGILPTPPATSRLPLVNSRSPRQSTPAPLPVVRVSAEEKAERKKKGFAGTVMKNGFRGIIVLLDSGSTHNFVHPMVAERLSLVLHPVSPFQFYVGNGDSLRCSYSCPHTPLMLHGHLFDIDLFLLEIHGPDIVLGIQWLQTLCKVSHDYANMTMDFMWKGKQVTLWGDTLGPKPISFNQLCSMAGEASAYDLYEVFLSSSMQMTKSILEDDNPAHAPPDVRPLLESYRDVFAQPGAATVSGVGSSDPSGCQYQASQSGYALIAVPLTNLLKKDSFQWTDDVDSRFQHLKRAITTAPVLRLLDFTKPFSLETDAFSKGIGAVLLQEGHPLVYYNTHEGLGVSPFQALYGRPPPSLFHTLGVRSCVPAIEELLKDRAELLMDLKAHLSKMQQRMRDQANRHRRDVSYAVSNLEQWLVQWSTDAVDDLAWEPVEKLWQRYPDLCLEDKADSVRGGVVMGQSSTQQDTTTSAVGHPKRNVGRPKRYQDYI